MEVGAGPAKASDSAVHLAEACHTRAGSTCIVVYKTSLFLSFFSKVPSFVTSSKNKKVDFLLSDDNPDCVDASIYRFLYTLFLQRAKLVEPTGPGKETMVS